MDDPITVGDGGGLLDDPITVGGDNPSVVSSLLPSSLPSDSPSTLPSFLLPSYQPSDTPSLCWSWSEAHLQKYLFGYTCGDETIYDNRADAESACIKCGSCSGITTDGQGNWSIRQGDQLNDSENNETSYLKVSCSDSPSDSPSNLSSVPPSTVPSDLSSTYPSEAPSTILSTLPSFLPSYQPSDTPSLCWSWSEAHPEKYLNGHACNDNKEYTIRDDAESACIKCGSDCSGITTDGQGIWSIRQQDQLYNSPNNETSYLKVSCSDSPSDSPSNQPSLVPSAAPTAAPSGAPSGVPSVALSGAPSAAPSAAQSNAPSDVPTNSPVTQPTPTQPTPTQPGARGGRRLLV